jgi:hypothetical protein
MFSNLCFSTEYKTSDPEHRPQNVPLSSWGGKEDGMKEIGG